MPSKKRQPKNAFSCFLDDAIVRLRKEGKNVTAKHEAATFVHQEWKNMSASEKAPYEERARDAKLNKDGIFRFGRLDCTGKHIGLCTIVTVIDLGWQSFILLKYIGLLSNHASVF